MEFHISRQARDFYQFNETLFTSNGNVIFANFHAVRLFVQKINQKKDLVNYPEQAVKAGQINALGLIDEILHLVIALYRRQINPQVMDAALMHLENRFGREVLDKTLVAFCQQFPPWEVYKHRQTIPEYLSDSSDGLSHRAVTLEEMLMLWVTNKNPAANPYAELFADDTLAMETPYFQVIKELQAFFAAQPTFGPEQLNLVEMLRSPALKVPYSLTGQLEYIRTHWATLLGDYLYRLLSSLDFIKEEEKLSFQGPGIIPVPVYDLASQALLAEPENFSPDREWMPRLVLIAKNSYVWLDQLSRWYQRPITRLDEIPDEELDKLASWGITGLWLIGLWERSPASARIKQMCGNPEAIASAYSLSGYWIANDLGGEEAYIRLRDRAWQRGIRLASDMVPNHMGIDSSWVIEHPDWFLSLDYSPYPSYSFNGVNLSPNPGIGIFLEDHYYDRTDAAVVFKRVDFNTGNTRYIYHGNDGTSMPWNDTAQLNYLNPQVREAVIQTILSVARKFPIIRFDAAMTLAKKHFQRLWFPEPGTGGAIPSRAEHGMTKTQFDQAFPVEFWREVVDRCAVEAPDTLLLAEAFWLMEGYFVRTLGMHRVYNSAFMNMLRNEDNAKYRAVMKNTLEFEPEILKRFVNFMNNPDERTAVEQFGKGDKYFGICAMMVTLPGLPMLGHGQVEGFAEKYGMEYRRAYWDETIDQYLVERHQREIFPLCHKRALFANVDHFLLYDFFTPEGYVNEDVYAYSNGDGNERALFIFHNKFAETQGTIHTSVGFGVKQGDQRVVRQQTIEQGLKLRRDENGFLIFFDQATGMEFIRPVNEVIERGFAIHLAAYEYHIFLNFRQVQDDDQHSYRHLCQYLDGRGVPNIEQALRELVLQPVLTPFRQIAHPGYFSYLLSWCKPGTTVSVPVSLLDESEIKFKNLLDGITHMVGYSDRRYLLEEEFRPRLENILSLPVLEKRYPLPATRKFSRVAKYIQAGLKMYPHALQTLIGWLFTFNLGRLIQPADYADQSLSWMEEWQLTKSLEQTYHSLGGSDTEIWRTLSALRLLVSEQNWYAASIGKPVRSILTTWLSKPDIQNFIGVNRHNGILWYNKERFEEFCWWMTCLAFLQISDRRDLSAAASIERLLDAHAIIETIQKAEKKSAYQVSRLIESLKS